MNKLAAAIPVLKGAYMGCLGRGEFIRHVAEKPFEVGERVILKKSLRGPAGVLGGRTGTAVAVYPGGQAAWVSFDDPLPDTLMCPFEIPVKNGYLIYRDEVVPLPARLEIPQ